MGSSREVLEKVGKEGDLDYVRTAAELEPQECLNRLHCSDFNIFHIAADENNVEFMDEAMKILPAPVMRLLLYHSQQDSRENPLHIAARKSHYNMVKLILDHYRSSMDEITCDDQKPWLGLDMYGQTPLHSALHNGSQRVALEILSMDVQLLSSIEDNAHQSPLYLALIKFLNRVALQILTCAPNCSFRGDQGVQAISSAPYCSGEVFKLMVEKSPDLIIGQDDDGETVLKLWIMGNKWFAINYILDSNVIAPHLRRAFIDQLSTVNNDGCNSLHQICISITNNALSVMMAKILVNAYKQERAELFSSSDFQPPWLMGAYSSRRTPLHFAIHDKKEELALYLFSLDKLKFLENHVDLLLFAIENCCPKVAERILGFIIEQQDSRFTKFLSFSDGRNALHYAPKCSEGFLSQLLETDPTYLSEKDDNGSTTCHIWIEIGESWPFEYILKNEFTNEYKYILSNQLYNTDKDGRRPLHLAAKSNFEEVMVDVIKLFDNLQLAPISYALLSCKDAQNNTPIDIAVSNRHEKLALLFLSLVTNTEDLEGDLLFKAIEYECYQVVQYLLDWTATSGNLRFLKSAHRNVLHLVTKLTEEICTFLLEKFPELMDEKDKDEKTPLDIASKAGATRIVELMLRKDHSFILKAPTAWVEACEESHLSTILAFFKESPHLRHLCLSQDDTPWHHIKGMTYSQYKEFLKQPLMNELKNTQNKLGKTPLHMALENKDKELAELLLSIGDVDRSIRDKNGRTPMELLDKLCETSEDWKEMRKRNNFDAFIRADTDLTEMRNMISIVAALLATITFTVGFQLPGGTDGGEATLATKVAFWVFLLSNVYAMCTAMLILFCIIWSMVSYKSESVLLLNRSLVLLKQSLYGTLLAFMTGVYLVINHKILWAAIVIFCMCSFVILSAGKSVLFKFLSCLPQAEDDQLMQLFTYLKGVFNKKKVNVPKGASPGSNENGKRYAETSCWKSLVKERRTPAATTSTEREAAQDQIEAPVSAV